MVTKAFQNAIDFIGAADTNQLNELAYVMKCRRAQLTDRSLFPVGSKVSFIGRTTGRWAGKQVGTVTKRNPKKAKVQVRNSITGSMVMWNVPYHLLSLEK